MAETTKKVVGVTFTKDNERLGGGQYSLSDCHKYHKLYSYFTDLDLKAGDKCVVDVSGMLRVVEVVNPELTGGATKWIIDKINIDAFREREERRKEIEAIERSLAQKVKEKKTRLKVEEILGDVEEAMKMLDWLKELSKTT